MGRVRLGTSGWDYPHWRGILYPRDLPRARWLARYAAVFSTVELNATFYRLPDPASVDRWREGTPPGFLFAAKGSRFLTHLKRLLETGEGVRRYVERIGRLGVKLGPVLWQLPPRMRPDPGRLDAFLAALPRSLAVAVEFRSEAWYRDDVLAVLDRHRAALCEHDLCAPPPRRTGAFRYLRFHGAGAAYRGRYGKARLRRVAAGLASDPSPAFVYFNNDLEGHAVRDALALSELLDAEGALPVAPSAP